MHTKFPLIPRARVNYTINDIFKSIVCRNKSNGKRKQCIEKLSSIFGGYDIKLVPSSRAPSNFEKEHDIANKILNLPFYYGLSDKEMNKVVEVINSIH